MYNWEQGQTKEQEVFGLVTKHEKDAVEAHNAAYQWLKGVCSIRPSLYKIDRSEWSEADEQFEDVPTYYSVYVRFPKDDLNAMQFKLNFM